MTRPDVAEIFSAPTKSIFKITKESILKISYAVLIIRQIHNVNMPMKKKTYKVNVKEKQRERMKKKHGGKKQENKKN